MFFLFFFFSSRRRHTRWNCDWSSDVCSSDLTHSGSFEWDHFLKTNANNRLLLTFTNQADQRKWIGQAFPSVTIVDGTKDRKSTRLNSSHSSISYAVFCLKKKKKKKKQK